MSTAARIAPCDAAGARALGRYNTHRALAARPRSGLLLLLLALLLLLLPLDALRLEHPDHGAQQASEDAAHALCTFMDKLTPLYFDVRGDDIEVETDPGGFYNRLLCGVQGARRRVVMTSLYLGTGKHEQDLVR